jgi:hypothetical protein
MYGDHGPVTTTRGNVHDYLGITFDFSVKGKDMIDMIDYIKMEPFSKKTRKSLLLMMLTVAKPQAVQNHRYRPSESSLNLITIL